MRRTNASMDGEKNSKLACFNFIKQLSEKKSNRQLRSIQQEASPIHQKENTAPKAEKGALMKHKLHLLGILKTNPTDKVNSQRAAMANLLSQQHLTAINGQSDLSCATLATKDEKKAGSKAAHAFSKHEGSQSNTKRISHLKSLRHLKTYLGDQKPKTPREKVRDKSSEFAVFKKTPIIERPSTLIKEYIDDDFEIGDMIGKGRFGSVYLARSVETELIFAMKVMNKNAMMKYRASKQLVREIRIHSMLDHPNIIRCYGVLQSPDEVHLLMEYAPYGNLFTKLRQEGKLEEKKVVSYIRQIISAFNYLQANQILHRDLKPENILISFDDQLKLADFGWAIQLPGNATMRHTFCGTLDYISPEMAQGEYYGLHTDNWSIGILVFELLTGELPFIRTGPYDLMSSPNYTEISYPEYLSEISRDFISRLLTQDPLKRMTLPEANRHPFLNSVNR